MDADFLDRLGIEWRKIEWDEQVGSLYATHEGEFTIAGHTLKVYTLNDGQRVIDADDFRRFFEGMERIGP